jgi:hypothetical protein
VGDSAGHGNGERRRLLTTPAEFAGAARERRTETVIGGWPDRILTSSAREESAMGQLLKAFSDLWDQTVQRMGWPAALALFAAGLLLAWFFFLLTILAARQVDNRLPTGVRGFVVGSLTAASVGATFLLIAFATANWFGAEFILWRGVVGGAVVGFVTSLFRRKRAPTGSKAMKPRAEQAALAPRPRG